VVLLLAHTGMRFRELVGLRVEDVDRNARRIRVRRSLTQVGSKLIEATREAPPDAARYPCHGDWYRSSPTGYRAAPGGPRHHLAQRCPARTGELEALTPRSP
jgi:integrase